MIEVKVPKEIKDYKEKFWAGLTVRQLVSCLIALIIIVPLYFFGNKIMNEELIGWVCMIIGVFIGAFGFYNHNGMNFERFAIAILKGFIEPNKLLYVRKTLLDKAIDTEILELQEEIKNSKIIKKKKL